MSKPDPSYNETLGGRVRVARQAAGMTQAALADVLGVDQSTVARLERGLVRWTAEAVAIAARATGATIESLTRDALPATVALAPKGTGPVDAAEPDARQAVG